MKSFRKKPLIFISHIHEHGNLGNSINEEIGRILNHSIDFFVSSDNVSMIGGLKWLNQIETALKKASVMLVICSKESVYRPWINFEAGAAWLGGKANVVPLCCGGLQLSDLPQPLINQYGYNLMEAKDVKKLVALIAKEVPMDIPSNFDPEKLVKTLANALSSSSVGYDIYLQPDPELAANLQKMGLTAFAVDGIVELCKSFKYSGWSREQFDAPRIEQERALPREFLDYQGDDARCETGCQERYSLRRIREPLLDSGSKIETWLARSRYADVFRLSRLLDKPFINRSGQFVTGRTLYGTSWHPLEKSPLIHNVNMQPIILTSDKKAILSKRSDRVHMYPGCWSASIEEQMVASDKAETYFECAERGLSEELGCTPNPSKTKILSVGIEYNNLSASFLCVVYIEESYHEVCKKWIHAHDRDEHSAIDCLELDVNILELALKSHDHIPNGMLCIRPLSEEPQSPANKPAKWHPTARMRLYALKEYIKGQE